MNAIFFVWVLLGIGLVQPAYAHGDEEKSHNHDEHEHKSDEHEHKHKSDEQGHDHKHETKNHEHKEGHGHEHEGVSKFGAGKAIEAIQDEGEAFKLAPRAVKTMGIEVQLLQMSSGDTIQIPSSALVFFQDEVGVYVLRDGWFRMVELNLIRRDGPVASIKTKDLKQGDQLVTSGVASLRIAHLEASGQGGQGHVH